MKVQEIVNTIIFSTKKHSPEILIVTGVIGVVASTVLACKATLKVNDILDETKETIDKIHEAKETKPEEYSEDDAKKDLAIVYVQTAWKLTKLYAPAIILGSLSLTGIFASNNILRKRNIALAAAYSTIDKSFKEYRKRVVDKFGEEVDKELRLGSKEMKIEDEVTDENGKTKKVKKTVNVSELSNYSDYAVYFDSTSPYHEKNDNYNLMVLRSQQRYANDILRTKGYFTYNDFLDCVGVQGNDWQRKAGMVVGWKFDKNYVADPVNQSDGQIDFRVIQTYRERGDGKVEPCIILDPNVDGNIYDKM